MFKNSPNQERRLKASYLSVLKAWADLSFPPAGKLTIPLGEALINMLEIMLEKLKIGIPRLAFLPNFIGENWRIIDGHPRFIGDSFHGAGVHIRLHEEYLGLVFLHKANSILNLVGRAGFIRIDRPDEAFV